MMALSLSHHQIHRICCTYAFMVQRKNGLGSQTLWLGACVLALLFAQGLWVPFLSCTSLALTTVSFPSMYMCLKIFYHKTNELPFVPHLPPATGGPSPTLHKKLLERVAAKDFICSISTSSPSLFSPTHINVPLCPAPATAFVVHQTSLCPQIAGLLSAFNKVDLSYL